MSQQRKKINFTKPTGSSNAVGKKRKHDQIGSKHSKQQLKKLKISSILPQGDDAPDYKPDFKNNSRIIKHELEAQKTRPTKQTNWKKVDVDASKFLLNEGKTLIVVFFI